ncbi:MAG: metal ABC transporter ATP-binding protein [Tepidisphaeraceae bacterium]
MSEPIVEICGVDFAYGQRLVLKHISMTVAGGTTVGVIGPNGAGKTTLVNLLLGLLTPTRGTVRICGMPPNAAVRRGDVVGSLPQTPRMPKGFPISVRQLVRLGLIGKLGLLGKETAADLKHVDWLLKKVGIEELADVPIGSLSGGELQRVYIARALAAQPHVLFLDEPTTGIDRAGQDQFIQFLGDLKQSLALTVILVSHDLRTVAAVCDRLACLNVTLHYHDVPGNMPRELAREMFGVDLPELRMEKSTR